MNCRTCNTFLVEDVKRCPQCGSLVAHTPYATEPDDPTAPASYNRPTIPSTRYGSELYASPPPPPSQYNNSEPYEAPAQSFYPQDPYHSTLAQQSPSSKGKKGPATLVIGLVLLIVITGAGSLVLFNTYKQPGSQTTKSATRAAISTPNPSTNPYQLGTGTLVMNDPIQDNSKGYGWDQYTTNVTACQFTTGAYEVDTPIHIAQICYARSSPQFSNFVFEAQMKIVKGDCGAILFRVDKTNNNFYDFEVCQNGSYEVDTYASKASPRFKKLIPLQSSSAIHSGPGQDNVLAVAAMGNTFTLYLNHQKIDSVTDSSYSQGQIGLYASGYFGDPTEVLFSNVKVWTL